MCNYGVSCVLVKKPCVIFRSSVLSSRWFDKLGTESGSWNRQLDPGPGIAPVYKQSSLF